MPFSVTRVPIRSVAPLGLWYAVNPQFYTPIALLVLLKAGGQCPPYKMVHEFHHDFE